MQQVDLVRSHLLDSAGVIQRTAMACAGRVAAAAALVAQCLATGGKLLLCGNGGSAADCQHVAAELLSRLSAKRIRRALPAIALTTDTSFLTAFSNDCGFDGIFARQIEALGRAGDALIVISTSGRSANVLRAAEVARERGLRTVALTGSGGPLAGLCDIAVQVPEESCQHVQEAHLAIEHALCDLVERALFDTPDEVRPCEREATARFVDLPPGGSATVRAGVGVIVLDSSGRILLERRSDCGLWGLTGGRIEPGESAEQAAVREVREETGLTVEITGLQGVYSGPRGRVVRHPDNLVQLLDVIVTARVLGGTLTPSEESFDLAFFDPDALPGDLVPPVLEPLEDLRAGRRGLLR